MSTKREIIQIDDIRLLVDNFYDKVKKDAQIGPIFIAIIQDRWPEHLDKMYRFWQTVLLEEHTYFGSPFPPHAHLPLKQVHFDCWLRLFFSTIDEFFAGEKAERAKWQARRMAEIFQAKIQYIQNNVTSPLL